jgi:hypothetical protein
MLANAPAPGMLPAYPPGFAAILSPIFVVRPDFPENVLLLKVVSIAAMMALGVRVISTSCHCRKLPRQLALALAVAVVITPAFVFLATSTVMSEGVFTLMLLLTVMLADRSVAAAHPGRDAVLAGALAAATVLVRSAGAPVLVAAMLYFLKVPAVASCRALCHHGASVPCALVVVRADTRAEHGGRGWRTGALSRFSYSQQLRMRWAGEFDHWHDHAARPPGQGEGPGNRCVWA